VMLVVVAVSGVDMITAWRAALWKGARTNALTEEWIARFNAVVPTDKAIVSVQTGWNSSWLLYMGRKGFVYEGVPAEWTLPQLCEMLTHNAFAAVVSPQADARKEQVLRCWPYRELAIPAVSQNDRMEVWRVSNTPPGVGPALDMWSGGAMPWRVHVPMTARTRYVLHIRYTVSGGALPAVSFSTAKGEPFIVNQPLSPTAPPEGAWIGVEVGRDVADPVFFLSNLGASGSVQVDLLELFGSVSFPKK